MTYASLLAFTLTCLFVDAAVPIYRPRPQTLSDDPESYHQKTRAAVDEVLSMREFADLRSDTWRWWLALLEWIAKKLQGVAEFFSGVPGWLWWTIVIWMVLTLVAILGHFAWVLIQMILSSSVRRAAMDAAKAGRGELLGIRQLDFDSVYQRARELLSAGVWTEATKYLYVAAILWLDRQGWVAFRVSKTNYDYLAELTRQPEHRAKFRQLTKRFESTVYGGEPCTATICQEMSSLVEALHREATPVVAV